MHRRNIIWYVFDTRSVKGLTLPVLGERMAAFVCSLMGGHFDYWHTPSGM